MEKKSNYVIPDRNDTKKTIHPVNQKKKKKAQKKNNGKISVIITKTEFKFGYSNYRVI